MPKSFTDNGARRTYRPEHPPSPIEEVKPLRNR